MKVLKKSIYFVLVITIIIFFLRPFATSTDEELTIYVGLSEDHAIKVIEAFERETKIKTHYISLSNGEILSKIRTERENPTSSVWFGGPVDTFVHAKREGLLRSYFSRTANNINEIYKDPQGYWTGIYVGSIAFVSNENWLHEKGLSPPASWNDLLLPEYRGMITMSDPVSSGMAYTLLSTLVQLKGEDEAFSYLTELDKQVNTYTKSGRTPGRYVGMGDAGVAIIFAHDAIKLYKEGFHNLTISFPKEGTGFEIGAVGIIKGAPNLEAAKRFVDWVLTKDAQEIGKYVGNYQLLTNNNAISPPEALINKELNLIPYDHNWSGLNRERLLKRWREDVLNE
ncbi:ABC transporter substrate-binding protein [Virgibacillus sp. W0430]|uniref:ABC transporter substrate-binding protein n=1 Tax=Virgibacillus sp. W0430 TaxID=3391580 RepID=UPI003F4679BE